MILGTGNNLCNILKEENRISSIRQRLYLEENVFNSLYIRLKNKYRSDKGFKTALKVNMIYLSSNKYFKLHFITNIVCFYY